MKATNFGEKQTTVKRWLFQNLAVVAAVIVAIANLWLFSKLAPILQDQRTLTLKVEALDGSLKVHENNNTDTEKTLSGKIDKLIDDVSTIKSNVSYIRGQLSK